MWTIFVQKANLVTLPIVIATRYHPNVFEY